MSRIVDATDLRNWVLYFANQANHEGNHEQAKAYNHCLMLIDEHTRNADAPPMEYPLPTWEQLPIDLDDITEKDYRYDKENDEWRCDECIKPEINECIGDDKAECPYPIAECCCDNLRDNVAKICFENDLDTKVAKALIDIIQKERERNECMYIQREYFKS